MANIVELKDSNNTKSYPITKGKAVYFEDESTAENLFETTTTLLDNFYSTEELGTKTEAASYRLNPSTGLCFVDSNYKLVKYPVTAGEFIKVYSDDRFQFQNNVSVPSSGTANRIGKTYGTFDNYITVPSGATYIVFSTTTSGSAAAYECHNSSKLLESFFGYDPIPIFESTNGYRLYPAAGTSSVNADYKIVKYEVKAGEKIYVNVTDYFWFQNVSYVPSSTPSNRVGDTYTNYSGYITVPSGVKFLVLSTLTDNSQIYAVMRSNWNSGIGSYATSYNYFGNQESDWVSLNVYSVKSVRSFPAVTGAFINICANPDSIPPAIKASGQYILRWYDKNGSLLSSNNAGFVNKYFPDVPTNAKTFAIEVTSGNSSVSLTPAIAAGLKIYVGYENIFSNVTTGNGKIYAPYHIPSMSRTVMNGGYVPEYWLDHLREKKQTIYDLNESIGEYGLFFAFVTDTHWPANYKNSPLLLRWLKENTPIRRFVDGGDVLTGHSALKYAFYYLRDWADKTACLNMRHVRGNHDANSMQSNTDLYFGNGPYYADLIRPIENEVTVTDGHLYYYERIEAQKVIIFYLDTGDMVRSDLIDFDAQISWMRSIVNTLNMEWSILVIQHVVYNGKDSSGNPILYSTGQKTIDYLSTVTNCNVIGLIGGHTHYDYSFKTAKGFPVIITTCDACGAEAAYDDSTRTEGTITEQVIDVFSINIATRKINVTRIGGVGSDRSFTY